jgi:hypothetical protein
MDRPSTAIVGAPLGPDLLPRRISRQRECVHRARLEFPRAPLGRAGGFRVLVDSDALAALGAGRDLFLTIGTANHSGRSSWQLSQKPRGPSSRTIQKMSGLRWVVFMAAIRPSIVL